MSTTKLTETQRIDLQSALRALVTMSEGLVEMTSNTPEFLVLVLKTVQAINSSSRRLLEIGLTADQQLTYAVTARLGAAVGIYDLDSYRVPDSLEGLV